MRNKRNNRRSGNLWGDGWDDIYDDEIVDSDIEMDTIEVGDRVHLLTSYTQIGIDPVILSKCIHRTGIVQDIKEEYENGSLSIDEMLESAKSLLRGEEIDLEDNSEDNLGALIRRVVFVVFDGVPESKEMNDGKGVAIDEFDLEIDVKHDGRLPVKWYDVMRERSSGGSWRGYSYKPIILDYKYVEQMANVFSSKYKINVRQGRNWAIDIENKVLEYNPDHLVTFTKPQVIALLLHEIGHLRHTDPHSTWKSPWYSTYEKGVSLIINALEDPRIDKIMMNSYEGAKDVYKAKDELVEEMSESYMKQSRKMRKEAQVTLPKVRENLKEIIEKANKEVGEEGEESNFDKEKKSIEEKIDSIESILTQGTLKDYVGVLLANLYDLKSVQDLYDQVPDRIKSYIDETQDKANECVDMESTHAILAHADQYIFPVIEYLLKSDKMMRQKMDKDLSDIVNVIENSDFPDHVKEYLTSLVRGPLFSLYGGPLVSLYDRLVRDKNKDTGITSLMKFAGKSGLPKEWVDGDYNALSDSTRTAQNELIKKLSILKTIDSTPRVQLNQRRGKLSPRMLYKHKLGSNRLFHKYDEKRDTIASYAFSIVCDSSGSMSGDKIISAARSFVLFSEVFTKMQIPIELGAFDYTYHPLKRFSDDLTQTKKKAIGGIVKMRGGGTVLSDTMERTEIASQPQKNKVVVVISDGDISYESETVTRIQKLKNEGVKMVTLVVGSSESPSYRDFLVNQLGFDDCRFVEHASEMPETFTDIIKSTILKK